MIGAVAIVLFIVMVCIKIEFCDAPVGETPVCFNPFPHNDTF